MSARRLGLYELKKTALAACQFDQRFSYALYVPTGYDPLREAVQTVDLIVAMHGSARLVQQYRDGFIELAERRGCFVLAPLFPVGIIEQGNVDNFKYIDFRGLRYDLILNGMIDEIAQRYGVAFRRTVMHGFSGGGQFVHRYLYLHAERLFAASVGAPGKITQLDETRPWWVGTGDVERRFGRRIDLDALRQLKLHLVVGADDIETHEITVAEGDAIWMDGANEAGVTRVDRIRTLAANWADHGIQARLELVPGVAHKGTGAVLQAAAAFLDQALG